MQSRYLIILILILLTGSTLSGQSFLSTHGKVIVNEEGDTVLLRGMGLGGWMLQEGYMLQTASFANAQYQIRDKIKELIGTEDTDLFYDAWLANHVRKIDIDSLKVWGFNSVRLPMDYRLFTLSIQEEPIAGEHTWLNKGFELTDSLISWCADNEMYVILDLHAAPGGQGYDQGISNYDDTKPSLWESQANKDKTVALWKKLAEKYADEPWVAGYDLINEPNWNLPGGTALKSLYREITREIRMVDNRHILFIEGNWFANDFTGLTPPWDDNMVYAPHKYWSINDQASIQWVLNIRNTHDVPLYLGESGENSNVWFRDAIRLLEDHKIGWAWWPMKKVESIAGPLSVIKTPEYQNLLNYWENGGNTPNAAYAKAVLMEMTENLKLENCIYQKDVIDAMFRQVYSDETIPYNTQDIPGVVFATDFDMGVLGKAYYDLEVANYQVSTGTFTSWNTGWAYRNDGVDIEKCQDNINTNGYNVGWIDTDEWMQYDVNIAADAVYDVHVRVASGGSGGRFHFSADNADISIPYYVSNTGGWGNWKTLIIPDVILRMSDKKLKFYADKAGFNVSSFEFIEQGAITSVPTKFMAAETVDENTIRMNINKSFDAGTLPSLPADFRVSINGNDIPITNIVVDTENPRIVYFTVNYTMSYDQTIKVSYDGNQINAQDGTSLTSFSMKDVKNTLPSFFSIPGKIEAEAYSFQSGVQLESTMDAGGGKNIGYLDINDYLDYRINVTTTGIYEVAYRVASEQAGEVELQLIDAEGTVTTLQKVDFPATGGWQNWTTINQNLQLPSGRYTLRMLITRAPFNMNWMEFTLVTTPTYSINTIDKIRVFPNPANNMVHLQAEMMMPQGVQIKIYSGLGQVVYKSILPDTSYLDEAIRLDSFPAGNYLIVIRLEDGSYFADKLVKVQN